MLPEETAPSQTYALALVYDKDYVYEKQAQRATFWQVSNKQQQYLALRHHPSLPPFKCTETKPSLLLLWVSKGIRRW